MKSLGLSGYALAIGAASALLAGCGGSQPPIGAPGAMPLSRAVAGHADRRGSWIRPGASGDDFLYVSGGSEAAGVVYVYTYPAGQFVAKITGFNVPTGECTDASGDVFTVTDNPSTGVGTIYEYAHGGTSAIATLTDPNYAFGCAIDPTTGNLAVSGDGVATYKNASGSPTIYGDPSGFGFFYCGYDNKGNLYLSAAKSDYNDWHRALLRLARGSSSFAQISLNKVIHGYWYFEPSVQWDGKHMTVSSVPQEQGLKDSAVVSVYRLKISGSSATVIGTTKLESNKNRHTGQSWIQSSSVIGIDDYKGDANVSTWAYPKGRKPQQTIWKIQGIDHGFLFGLTLSVAGSRQRPAHRAREGAKR